MKAIIKRELHSLLTGVSGYIFCGFILLFAGIYMTVINLKSGSANFEYVLGNMAFIFLVAIPILTMRSFSEERRQKTDTLLYSLPVSMTKIVLGKYIAILIFLALPIVIIGLYPLILSFFGKVYLPASYGALLGFWFLGGALGAIGLFISSLTENQAVSAVVCLIVLLVNYFLSSIASYVSSSAHASSVAFIVSFVIIGALLYFMTKNPVLSGGVVIAGAAAAIIINVISPASIEGLFPKILGKLSLFDRFFVFPNGEFSLSSLIYFAVVAAVFIFFTVQSMEKRRWS